jgi:LysR family transcriptional regulator, glycine cleavage system transcriptional activator
MAARLPSLNALRAFECAARHGSLSLAASELNVTHAAISRHIRDLEAWLGAKLFLRTGRGVELTTDGEALAKNLTPAFEMLIRALDYFTPPDRRRELTISVEVPFATLWLVPRLGRFTSAHPDIDLIVDPEDRLVDLNKGEADLGIRYGRGQWSDVEATKLFDADLTPVCSPGFLEKHDITTPADLDCNLLIQDDTKQHWRAWLDEAGLGPEIQPTGPLLLGHLAIAAAEAGQGFALVDGIQAGDALLAGRLVCPFCIVVRHHAYYLVKGSKTKEKSAAAQFRAWMIGEIASAAPALNYIRNESPPAVARDGKAAKTTKPTKKSQARKSRQPPKARRAPKQAEPA